MKRRSFLGSLVAAPLALKAAPEVQADDFYVADCYGKLDVSDLPTPDVPWNLPLDGSSASWEVAWNDPPTTARLAYVRVDDVEYTIEPHADITADDSVHLELNHKTRTARVIVD